MLFDSRLKTYFAFIRAENVSERGCDLEEDVARLVLVLSRLELVRRDRRVAQDLQVEDWQLNEAKRFKNSNDFWV